MNNSASIRRDTIRYMTVNRDEDRRERDWDEDFDDENGFYENTCLFCEETFSGHRRRACCRKCAEEK